MDLESLRVFSEGQAKPQAAFVYAVIAAALCTIAVGLWHSVAAIYEEFKRGDHVSGTVSAIIFSLGVAALLLLSYNVVYF